MEEAFFYKGFGARPTVRRSPPPVKERSLRKTLASWGVSYRYKTVCTIGTTTATNTSMRNIIRKGEGERERDIGDFSLLDLFV